ncbi:MotA/TolQ/ExbB proton channel family protein [Halochromatium salexigens]|uniref:Flagellar motor protein MotA n=1 Tax=Halochromatium salexigens TaxID=49447 RepID=A0AAJ0UFD4_HALSE|nr:MotA/TolQ/ExbB proton channel family protein [Halochromatium salexigens]MBK5930439.1 flagellar motor protein MotA [Halochromatium salexigens]
MSDDNPINAVESSLGIPSTPNTSAAGTLTDTLGQGGPVLWILALLSVAALAIVLVKLWQFSRLRLNASDPVERALRHWSQYAPESALVALQGSPQPSARLLARTLEGLSLPGADLGLLREELTRFASAQLEQLRAWLRALEVIAALSPLLGLLGTVLGMIEAFRQLELAGSQVDPAILSGGIWQALLTTAAGLSVAIPVVLVHSWLERRVERCGHRMEDAVTRVFTRDLGRDVPPSASIAEQPEPQTTSATTAAQHAS